MKKHLLAALTLVTAMTTTLTSWAELPILVGHRGSSFGVENSVESFTNGAKRGYQYLETDFKVTGDGQLVCSHDDDISRLSGGASNLAIASSTLADLQAVPFTQTRLGTTYTGRLCSAQEYLDVCKEYNVRPLIELKWATGINSNDQSNIPMLIEFIEKNGFRDKCIILTSMKPCLEYIRKNYPDIELQFLTGQYWANHFDWCVTNKIDVDIQAGYFDKSTVKKYHDAGLKVNMWTTNDNDGYKQYGNWGCDFITTDNLDPTTLPELDASVTFPPNTVDYPENERTIRGSYTPEKVCEFDMPAVLSGLTVRRALMRDGIWTVLAADASGKQSITRVDALTGESKRVMDMTGIDGTLGDIAFTADGVLLAPQVTTVPFGGGGDVFKVYSWAAADAAPAVFITVSDSALLGNFSKSVAGEVFTASGRLDDLMLYVSTHSATASTYRIAGLTVKSGAIVAEKSFYCFGEDYTAANWGDFSMTVTPFSRKNIIIDSPTKQPVEYTFNWDVTRNPLEEYSRPATGLLPDAATGMSFLRHGIKVYALVPGCAADRSAVTATLHDVTDGLDKATAVSPALTEGLGSAPATHIATGFSYDGNRTYMHLFAAGQGMASFLLEEDKGPVTVYDVDLELTRDWILSNTTGNHPGNIDGTNAQQGTAVNGLFYVNNCADKKIYVFNEKGLVGDMPGGAGWGCARDDAGNIIVRDDKLTADTHSFIVYPAGATPTAPGTPVTFTATVPLTGQTNFINASGDVLGGTGHIYLYPNKQTAVAVITVTKGAVTGTSKSGELAIAGSTAGYVIPIDDNSENFVYQVRTQQVYIYNGGSNDMLIQGRPSTTVPNRNSTGGGAYFMLRGNRIYVHNSGANYKGGFTVRNMTTDKVVKSIDPIGTLAYENGGNYSTFNWLIAEPIDEGSAHIYQYCPANGISVYTLRDKNYTGVEDIVSGNDAEATYTVSCDGNTLTVFGGDVRSLDVYTVSGIRVATASGNTADVSVLPAGMYVARVNNATGVKFIK